MIKRKITLHNASGLHIRPAGLLCKEAVQYKCSITFRMENITANAKSVLSVLGACVQCGDEVEFIFDGEDEQAAMEGIVRVIDGGLD